MIIQLKLMPVLKSSVNVAIIPQFFNPVDGEV